VKFEIQDPREIDRLHDLYLGEVWTADHLFAQLLSTLRETGLAQTTVVALTADHGEAFHEHGRFQHSLLYEEQLRIPLILHHPDAESGVVTDVRARSIDLMPTLLAAVGHPVNDMPLDGVNLLDLSPEDPPNPTVAVITTGKRMMSLLDGDEKLIIDCRSDDEDEPVRVELFDLATDPYEQNDLATTRSNRLRPLLNELRLRVGGSPCRLAERLGTAWERQENLDPERLKALRALGYVR
jgi:arylsulfatase A-like enzyme